MLGVRNVSQEGVQEDRHSAAESEIQTLLVTEFEFWQSFEARLVSALRKFPSTARIAWPRAELLATADPGSVLQSLGQPGLAPQLRWHCCGT